MRLATAADIPLIVEMGARFVAAAWEMPYRPEDAHAFVSHVVEHGAVFLADGAMLGATVEPLYFNTSVLIASEHFWWSERRGAGLPLLAAFEAWAAERGAHMIHVSTVHDLDSPARRIFERRGYRLRECSHVKEVA